MPDDEIIDLPDFLSKKVPAQPRAVGTTATGLRPVDAAPVAIERAEIERAQASGKSYEEANWARLSPLRRDAINRLRQARGQSTIPPPKIDLYVPPRAPVLKPFDPSDPDFVRSVREFNGPILGPRGGEGFTINGKDIR